MEVTVPLGDDLSLRIADDAGEGAYPTRRLQKGLLLIHAGRELAEEGIGFGVPVLKRGVQTVFPGGLELAWRQDGAHWEVEARFRMDLVERLAGPDGARVGSRALYAAKDALAALHRRAPALRGLLTATSSGLRRAFGWETTYVETAPAGTIAVTYEGRSDERRVAVSVDLTELRSDGVSEAVVMNEQGARHFRRYQDSDGATLDGDGIGAWDEVTASTARFVSPGDGVAFSLRRVPGARLYRGRELIGSRLAWSGFGYSLPPTVGRFDYDVGIEEA